MVLIGAILLIFLVLRDLIGTYVSKIRLGRLHKTLSEREKQVEDQLEKLNLIEKDLNDSWEKLTEILEKDSQQLLENEAKLKAANEKKQHTPPADPTPS